MHRVTREIKANVAHRQTDALRRLDGAFTVPTAYLLDLLLAECCVIHCPCTASLQLGKGKLTLKGGAAIQEDLNALSQLPSQTIHFGLSSRQFHAINSLGKFGR